MILSSGPIPSIYLASMFKGSPHPPWSEVWTSLGRDSGDNTWNILGGGHAKMLCLGLVLHDFGSQAVEPLKNHRGSHSFFNLLETTCHRSAASCLESGCQVLKHYYEKVKEVADNMARIGDSEMSSAFQTVY